MRYEIKLEMQCKISRKTRNLTSNKADRCSHAVQRQEESRDAHAHEVKVEKSRNSCFLCSLNVWWLWRLRKLPRWSGGCGEVGRESWCGCGAKLVSRSKVQNNQVSCHFWKLGCPKTAAMAWSRFASWKYKKLTSWSHFSASRLRFSWQAHGFWHVAKSSTNQPCVYFPTAFASTGPLKIAWTASFSLEEQHLGALTSSYSRSESSFRERALFFCIFEVPVFSHSFWWSARLARTALRMTRLYPIYLIYYLICLGSQIILSVLSDLLNLHRLLDLSGLCTWYSGTI